MEKSAWKVVDAVNRRKAHDQIELFALERSLFVKSGNVMLDDG